MRCSQSENLICPLNPRCAELCSAIAQIARPSPPKPIGGIGECITPHLPVRIEPRSAKSYPSSLAARVLPLNITRENQQLKSLFGTLEDLSQDFKIVSLGKLSGSFGTLRDFFLGRYWTLYCRWSISFLGSCGGRGRRASCKHYKGILKWCVLTNYNPEVYSIRCLSTFARSY